MQNGTLLDILNIKSKTVNNAVIQIGDIDDSGKGRHFVSKFIQDGLVKIEGHGIVLLKKETIDQSLQSMVGAPVIIKHQDVTNENADDLRCGVISKAYFNDLDGWYYCEGIIWDEKAKELVNNGWSVSCSYDFLAYNDEGGEENNIHYDKEFTQLNFTHLALVDNPRYERANIVFNCKVDNETDKYGNEGHWIWQDEHPVFIEEDDPYSATGHSALLSDIMKRIGYSQVEFFRNKPKDKPEYYAYRAETGPHLRETYEKYLKQHIDTEHRGANGRVSRWFNNGIDVIVYKGSKTNNSKESEQDNMVLNALKQLITAVENKKDGDANGRWVTIKGTHVFIPDGKSVDEVMKEKGMGTSSTEKKDDDELVVVEKADPAAVRKEKEAKSRWDKTMKEYGDLKGKYERDDVDWDEEQLAKDIKTAQDRGYAEVEDIAEFLGLDEDEVRETLSSQEKYSELKAKLAQYKKQALEGDSSTFTKQIIEGLQRQIDELKNDPKAYANARMKEMGLNKTNNNKEQDMAILEELKKLITKVENNKENEEMIENEKVDKRKLIDEVGGILKDKVDEEVWRTIIGKLEKMSYNESEAGTADNKKVKNEDKEEDKKVENEDEKDEKKVEEIEEDVKKDVDNKCKNSKSSFDKINEIYNSIKQVAKESQYVSRQEKLDNAVEYFK